jgi:hypothetical protein
MNFSYIDHTFMSSHTVRAAIRLHNNYPSDQQLIDVLISKFYEVNGNEAPRVGRSYKIPVAV